MTPTRYNFSMLFAGLTLRRVLRAYAISIAIWAPISLLVTWQMYTFEHSLIPTLPLSEVFLVYSVRHLSAALLTPPLFYIASRWPVTENVVARTVAYLLGSIPFALAFAAIRLALVPYYVEQLASWQPRSFHAFVELALGTYRDIFVLYYLGIIVAAHAYSYFQQGQQQAIERLSLRQALAQSELQVLRAQLHPHFLFNTLQGISTLIVTDRETARAMLHTLAELLRRVLKYGSADVIQFDEELAFVKAYLELEQMRLGRRLIVRWHIDPGVEAAHIPQLLLQPLVENAIQHGIAGTGEGGWIEIEACLKQDQLIVVIRNSTGGGSGAGLGVGIPNTRARLRFLYGEDATFEFSTREDGTAVAEVALPGFTAPLEHAGTA